MKIQKAPRKTELTILAVSVAAIIAAGVFCLVVWQAIRSFGNGRWGQVVTEVETGIRYIEEGAETAQRLQDDFDQPETLEQLFEQISQDVEQEAERLEQEDATPEEVWNAIAETIIQSMDEYDQEAN